jgi:predicted pyridoxine 5'-phosphate oxidase superfamily flavin-nucleotide-binding protein
MADGLSHPSSDVAFTPVVKAVQARRGSRDHYAGTEAKGGFRTIVTPDLAAFLAAARSFYLATASAEGQPYVQHRGGPPGFLRVIDTRTLGFADYKGNRQYITTGNLSENPRAYIFVMDYARRRRVKLWGRARVVEDDRALLASLWPEGYTARPSRSSCSSSRPGTPTARSTSRRCSTPTTWPARSSSSRPASTNSKSR